MKKFLFVFCLILLVLPVQLGANAKRALSKDLMMNEVHRLINEYRYRKGLQPLRLLAGISRVATQHSENMAALKIPFGHEGFDERSDEVLTHKASPSSTGENVFMCFGYDESQLAKMAVNSWIESKGHRENIEKNFVYTGIGIAEGKGGSIYFTQFFVGQ
jgi:uncharacterized protein YkwD